MRAARPSPAEVWRGAGEETRREPGPFAGQGSHAARPKSDSGSRDAMLQDQVRLRSGETVNDSGFGRECPA
jgi:hypothetical protein